jgi:hypothetical protein
VYAVGQKIEKIRVIEKNHLKHTGFSNVVYKSKLLAEANSEKFRSTGTGSRYNDKYFLFQFF